MHSLLEKALSANDQPAEQRLCSWSDVAQFVRLSRLDESKWIYGARKAIAVIFLYWICELLLRILRKSVAICTQPTVSGAAVEVHSGLEIQSAGVDNLFHCYGPAY